VVERQRSRRGVWSGDGWSRLVKTRPLEIDLRFRPQSNRASLPDPRCVVSEGLGHCVRFTSRATRLRGERRASTCTRPTSAVIDRSVTGDETKTDRAKQPPWRHWASLRWCRFPVAGPSRRTTTNYTTRSIGSRESILNYESLGCALLPMLTSQASPGTMLDRASTRTRAIVMLLSSLDGRGGAPATLNTCAG
jgi:hypothetical protein